MRKQFDIKFRPQIESGEYKVETRDGRPARIICWDLGCGLYVIVAVIQEGCDAASVELYTDKGFYLTGDTQSGYDLFVVTQEPELSEFEIKVHEILYSDKPEYSASDPESWKRAASELLSLARKEIEKDLPRWVKVNEGVLLDKHSRYLLCSNEGYYYCCGVTIARDGYMLLVDDLEKLPKEDEK